MTLDADLVRLLKRLKLGPRVLTWPERLALARAQQLDYAAFLTLLLADEVQRRKQQAPDRHLLQAGFEERVTLDQFDWTSGVQLDRRHLQALFTLSFLVRKEHVLLVGPVGVGKSFVAQALETIRRGYSAYFVTMQQMVDYLSEGTESVGKRMSIFLRPKLLVIDEVGCLPLDRRAANWFFELVSRRYERGSVILTSNKSFEDWTSLFPDVAIASAILDRPLHHSTTINIRGGESYRLKEKRRAGLLQKADPTPS